MWGVHVGEGHKIARVLTIQSVVLGSAFLALLVKKAKSWIPTPDLLNQSTLYQDPASDSYAH